MFAAFETLRCAWAHFIVTCWSSASDRRNRGHQNVVFIVTCWNSASDRRNRGHQNVVFIVTCWNTSNSASDRRNRGHQNVVFIVTCWNTSNSASDRRNRGHQNVVFILDVQLPTSLFLLTLRWLMSYIYGAPILDVSRSHTTTQHSR